MIACSTKKDNFATRNFQALNTKYNVLYNGGIALDKGVETVKSTYTDNFWEVLPVERQQLPLDPNNSEKTKNPDFDRAELKATKAIQRRSMNIDGSERNTQIDEAHLMLGKSRYYDQRFIPALEAFNYILYKYPKSDKIYDARIWIEKTKMRLDNDDAAISNLTNLLNEIKLKNQTFADANAILAQAFIKTEQKNSAISKLNKAIQFTKINEEKARFRFIKAQLFEQLSQKDSAFATYQEIINMNRKSPRVYVMHAHIRQAQQFNFDKNDTILFLKNYNKLLADRENRPFLDVLNHQFALFYDQKKNYKQAKIYYNKSLKNKSGDQYLEASNYRNIADINFYDAKYVAAGKYYDSTMTKLKPRSREFNFIKKKRENLDDVIKYESIANTNDSILNVLSMNNVDKNKYYQEYIDKLKIADDKQKLADDKKNKNATTKNPGDTTNSDLAVNTSGANKGFSGLPKPNTNTESFGTQSNFYFYNQNALAFGRIEFKKNWGDRTLKDNWRNSILASTNFNPETNINNDEDDEKKSGKAGKIALDPKYDLANYIDKLPKNQSEIDILAKDRNFAYYQLGVIYKEKFNELKLAQAKLESLMTKNPEERLILPTMYNLYKIYEIVDLEKAAVMKADIIKLYPDSRYAQLLLNGNTNKSANDSPENEYISLYRMYKNREYRSLISLVDKAIDKYTGDEIQPKFELLKANNIGKIKGLVEYKKALNYVSLTYPNVSEGKEAEKFINKDIVAMEALQFNVEKPLSWKIIYRLDCNNDANAKPLLGKITKFLNNAMYARLKTSTDLYLIDEDFIVIHNLKTENEAKDIVSILKEFTEYKVTETPIIISSDNYKIIQIKKNIDEYLLDPKKVAKPVEKKVEASKEIPEEIKKMMLENNKTRSNQSPMPPNMPNLGQDQMQENDPAPGQQMKTDEMRQKK
ncbi:MAG: gliding motility protein [Flavobacterium sp.]|nr:gliding motility protein [Flavobacterium sp.]